MDRGYFNTILAKPEIAIINYICNYVSKKEKNSKQKMIRLAKIAVHVIIKLKLPVRLYWYEMGCLPVAQAQIPVNYDFESEKGLLLQGIENTSLDELDKNINEAMKIYTPELNSNQIRRKQYEFLNDRLYLAILDAEDFKNTHNLITDKKRFIELIVQIIKNTPCVNQYDELNETLNNFAVASNALLKHSTNPKEISKNIFASLDCILKYLSALNAKYKRIPGFNNFKCDITEKDIQSKAALAKNSVTILDNLLNEQNAREKEYIDNSPLTENLLEEFTKVFTS